MKLESRRLHVLELATLTLPIINLVSLPKICISIVSNTQDKLKTMCVENLAGKTKCIMGYLKVRGCFWKI